jgi:hypothetical protein
MDANDNDLSEMENLKNIKALIFDRGSFIKGDFLKKLPEDARLMAIKTFEFNFRMENIARLSELGNFLYFMSMTYTEMEKFSDTINFQMVMSKQKIVEFVRQSKVRESKDYGKELSLNKKDREYILKTKGELRRGIKADLVTSRLGPAHARYAISDLHVDESRKITYEMRYYLRYPNPYSSDPIKRDEWSISFLCGKDDIVYEIIERGTPTQIEGKRNIRAPMDIPGNTNQQ